MAPKYRLNYFNLRARGELIRWIFHYAGQEFEDRRIEFAQWPGVKPTAPDGTLPFLEVDGQPLSQSTTIARYVAHKMSLAGKDNWENAQCDAIVDFVGDAAKDYVTWVGAFMAKDQKKADTIKEKYMTEGIISYLQALERKLQENNGGQEYFVGSKPTWADFSVVIFFDELKRLNEHVLDKHALLRAHSDRIHELKGIREWIAQRPDTPI